MMLASGAIPNMTPRQTAGADGPKSVRNVITGRAMSGGRRDPNGEVRRESESGRDVALVVGDGDQPERVLVEQRLARGDAAERPLPGCPLVLRAAELDGDG